MNKISIVTNIPVSDAGKVQGKIKEEKPSIGVEFLVVGRVTRSRSKKGFKPLTSHLILDLDPEETLSKMTSPVSEAHKLLIDIDTIFQHSETLEVQSHVGHTTPRSSAGFSSMSSEELTLAPKWQNDSISRKRNVVPILVSMEDTVSKCLGRSMKPKKLKTKSMIDFDENTKHWTTDITRPEPNKDAAMASEVGYAMEQIDLGIRTRAVDVKHLETSTK